MGIFFGWILFSFIVGLIGSDRKIGFWGSFLLSLILSPLIGIIFALSSGSNSDEDYKKKLLKIQEETLNFSKAKEPKNITVIEELEKLSLLKEKQMITDEEFLNLKANLLGSNTNSVVEAMKDSSIYYFIYEIEDLKIPHIIENNLNCSNNDQLLYQITEGEKFIKQFECKEYPFFAVLVLDKRKAEIPIHIINQLELLAKKYFQCDSINDALMKIRENDTA